MSQFYDQASLVMVPSGYKAGKVYSQKPLSTDGELTFTRNSNATRVNADGKLEKVRENLCLNSQNQLASNWLSPSYPTTGIVTASTTVDPFGGTNAFKLAYGTGAQLATIVTATAGTTYTTSVWVRRVTGSTKFKFFDTNNSATIFDIDGTWQRFSVTSTANTTTGRLYVQVFDSSSEIEVFGAQFEVSDFGPTQYIPTTSAAVSVGPTANVPRLDYSGGGCGALKLEPQRTNLFTYSEQFDNAAWNKSNTTITANSVSSPDGYSNADTITASGSGVITHRINRLVTTTSGSVYAFSVFAKKGNTDFIALRHDNGGTFNYFNINTGTKGATCDASATIQNYGNGWYRCTVFHTATVINGGEIYLATANGVVSFEAAGEFAYLYGAQYELGSYASSYIPTLGASVTRLADSASKTGIASLIGQTEGTLFAEFDISSSVNTEGYIARIDDTSFNDTVYIVRSAIGTLTMALRSGGSPIASSITLGVSGRNKAAIAYKSGEFAFYLNGTQVGTSTATYTNGITYDDFRIGGFNASVANMAGVIHQALLFKTRLSNADLETLTTL